MRSTPHRPLIGVSRRGACGPIWHLDTGDGGVQGAAWCPSRAARHRRRGYLPAWKASEREVAEALGRARRLPRWLWLAPREDAFTPQVSPERRQTMLAIARHVFARGVDVALTTRGGLRDAEGLIELARAFPGRLSVRIGVFAGDAATIALWEPGLAPTGERIALASALRAAGAEVAVELGPIVPFVNDDGRGFASLARKIARAGVEDIVPRWVEGAPGLLEQVRDEVSRGASRMLGGWLGQPNGRVPGGRRVIPFQARRPRRRQLHEAAQGLGLGVIECRCVLDGESLACPTAPQGLDRGQLDLFKRRA